MYKNFFKPLFDFLAAFFGIILLSPFLLIIAIIIKCTSKGPVLFKQERVGKNKKLFKIWKFRTMRIDTPKDMPTHMLQDADSYITGVGKFLRKTSLDELPQIFNILAGKMSVIGPRPALYNQDDLVAERDKYHANDIKPGLTGWAQINGRDELPIPVKAKLDGEYVEKMGLFFDIKVFFMTIGKVFKHDGVVEGKVEESESAENTETSEETTNENVEVVNDSAVVENETVEINEEVAVETEVVEETNEDVTAVNTEDAIETTEATTESIEVDEEVEEKIDKEVK